MACASFQINVPVQKIPTGAVGAIKTSGQGVRETATDSNQVDSWEKCTKETQGNKIRMKD